MRFDILKLRSEMLRKEISQTDLATRTGMSRPTINGICCGRACKGETGEKIAEVLGVNVEELKEKS